MNKLFDEFRKFISTSIHQVVVRIDNKEQAIDYIEHNETYSLIHLRDKNIIAITDEQVSGFIGFENERIYVVSQTNRIIYVYYNIPGRTYKVEHIKPIEHMKTLEYLLSTEYLLDLVEYFNERKSNILAKYNC